MGKSSRRQQEIETRRAQQQADNSEKSHVAADTIMLAVLCPICGEEVHAESEDDLQIALELHTLEHPEDAVPPPPVEEPVEEAPVADEVAPEEPAAPVAESVSISDLKAMIESAVAELTGTTAVIRDAIKTEQNHRQEAKDWFVFVDGLPTTITAAVKQMREWADLGLGVDLKALDQKSLTLAELYQTAMMTPLYALGKSYCEAETAKVQKHTKEVEQVNFKEQQLLEAKALKEYKDRKKLIFEGRLRADHERHPILDVIGWCHRAAGQLGSKAKKDKRRISDQEFYVKMKEACREALSWYGIIQYPPSCGIDAEYEDDVRKIVGYATTLRADYRARREAAEDPSKVEKLSDDDALHLIGLVVPRKFEIDTNLGKPQNYESNSQTGNIGEANAEVLRRAKEMADPRPNQATGRHRSGSH